MAKQPNPKVVTKKHLARLERERIQQRYLIIATIAVLALIVGFILYGVLDQTLFTRMRPVAKVGNVTITSGDFIDEVRFDRLRSIQQLESLTADTSMLQFFGSYVSQIGNRLTSSITLGQSVLDSMIEDVLIAQEAEKLGIVLSEDEINREMEQQFGFYENGTPTPTITATPFIFNTSTFSPTQLALIPPTATAAPTSDATATLAADVTATPGDTSTPEASLTPTPAVSPTITFTPTITPTATTYTRQLYDENLDTYINNASEIDLSVNELREFISKQLLRRKVQERIMAEVQPVEEQVWARHILVGSEEEAMMVLTRLKQGEKFENLAAELSLDESNKAQGGDLSWFTHSQMVATFADAAFALQVGEVSQPVQSEFGYHIIQVLGKEVRPLSTDQLATAKEASYQDWLDAAKTAANVITYERWMEVVPSDPEVPSEILQILDYLSQQQQQ